jgi:hypothetical protein
MKVFPYVASKYCNMGIRKNNIRCMSNLEIYTFLVGLPERICLGY